MTTRFVADTLDLSSLPSPDAITSVDYEAILAARLARYKALWPDFDVESLETDPAVVLQQEDAYREALTLASINDRVKAVMVATAMGNDLDNLAAFYGVRRLTITAATNSAPAVMEGDSDLRRRVQLAPEALPYAGMTGGGYRSLALRTAPSLKDVSTVKRTGGRVDVILLGRTGNRAVDSTTVNTVAAAFRDDAATQLTDVVSVLSATIVPFTVSLKLRIPLGPDHSVVRQKATAAVAAYLDSRHRVGLTAYATGIIAAAQVGSVEQVIPMTPLVDVVAAPAEAPFCTSLTITSELAE